MGLNGKMEDALRKWQEAERDCACIRACKEHLSGQKMNEIIIADLEKAEELCADVRKIMYETMMKIKKMKKPIEKNLQPLYSFCPNCRHAVPKSEIGAGGVCDRCGEKW